MSLRNTKLVLQIQIKFGGCKFISQVPERQNVKLSNFGVFKWLGPAYARRVFVKLELVSFMFHEIKILRKLRKLSINLSSQSPALISPSFSLNAWTEKKRRKEREQ